MNEKNEKYIATQKKKFDKILGKKEDYMKAFYKACKKGKLNIYIEYLTENGKVSDFESMAWDKLCQKEEYKEQLMKFASKLAIVNMRANGSDELATKIEEMYATGKLKYFDLFQLSLTDIKKNQQEIVGKLLDITTDENMEIGIHRTGGSISGQELCNQGIYLTGHLSSGVTEKSVSRSDLDRNISFYKQPGLIIRSLYTSGNYKNHGAKDEVDTAIVCIPKGIMDNKDNDVVIEDKTQNVLNPKYINGYVTVSSRVNTILDYIQNEQYKTRSLSGSGNTFETELSNNTKTETEQMQSYKGADDTTVPSADGKNRDPSILQ